MEPIWNKMLSSSTRVKITNFFKKSETGRDLNTSSRSDLNQAVEKVEGKHIAQEEYLKNMSIW